MKDKLILKQGRDYRWRISWWIAEVDEIGVTLGEEHPTEWMGSAPKTDEREAWKHRVAQRAASITIGVGRDDNGFYWESQNDARCALRFIKEALKQDRHMPKWATKALAEGWKPPKGWKA